MPRKVFISHNKSNKDLARDIGAQLFIVGANVWFDEWSIAPGESIPQAINAGFTGLDDILVFWSTEASSARWVTGEIDAAIMSNMRTGAPRIIPCLLDETPLPPLLAPYNGIDFRDVRRATEQVCDVISGTHRRRARLLAIQRAIHLMDEIKWYPYQGIGPTVCCHKCGADVSKLHSTSGISIDYDMSWFQVQCEECGWTEGGET